MTRPLTILEAAAKVKRSRTQIKQWIRDGMPSQLVLGKRYVNLPDLLAWAAEHGRQRGSRLPDE